MGGTQVIDQLPRGIGVISEQAGEPHQCLLVAMLFEIFGEFCAQTRHALCQRVTARRTFAQPKWNTWRRAVRVFHAHRAALDAHDLIRLISELKHIAGHALDGEIFIDGADVNRFRLEHNVVVGGVGNCAA